MVPSRFGTGHFYTQSVRHFLVVSTNILVNSTHNYFLQQMAVSTPFIVLFPNTDKKKKCVFVCTVYCKYFNIIIIFFLLQYIVKSTFSLMFMFTFFVLLLQIHYCYVHTQLFLALYMCVFIFGFPCGYF